MGERSGTLDSAVEYQNLCCSHSGTGEDRGSRGPACSHNDCGTAVKGNTGLAQIALEASSIGIVTIKLTVSINHTINRAQDPRFFTQLVHQCGGVLLVRYR